MHVQPAGRPKVGLRMLADAAYCIVWEADRTGLCVYLDPHSAKYAAPRSVRMSDWSRVIHPDDLPAVRELARCLWQRKEQFTAEYRVLRSDGTVRWIHSTTAPKLDAAGRVTGFLGTLVDVSRQHATRERLLRSEAEHRLLTENAGDMVSYMDAHGNYVYVSPSHTEILGYQAQEMIGQPVRRFLHPEDLAKAEQSAPLRTGGLLNMRARRKDGGWVWISANTRAVIDPASGKKQGSVAVGRDITQQMAAQREQQRREERFRSLTKLSSDWYWELSAEGRYTFISEGIFLRLGLPQEHIVGRDMKETAYDSTQPGVVEFLARFAAREPFRDLVVSVCVPTFPGVVRHTRMSGEPFYEDGVFQGYRGATRDVTRELKTAGELQRLATSDVLTGLANRAAFDERLAARLSDRRGGAAQAVFFIDLDRFKEVNDSLGHKFGDALLQEIARRLRACLRPEDVLARMGGDEFVLLAECSKEAVSAARIAEKLLDALAAPVLIGQQEIRVGTSIGISMHPRDGDTAQVLMSSADSALYRAKAQGRGQYCFFTAEMREEASRRLTLQQDMRHAAELGQLSLHYQPRVHLQTMEVTGMEALLRWRHEKLGPISPLEFIPLAEETGQINELGNWVLLQATRQAQEWRVRSGRDLVVSVNLSARQLQDRRILTAVQQALASSGLPGRLLELEVTESVLMKDAALACDVMRSLKAMDVRLAIDDFGTGYSALSSLRQFPLDCLKLDRSFLQPASGEKIDTMVLAQSVIDLAHALDLTVVSEGVESTEHLQFLRGTACDEIQGFVISEPKPAEEFFPLFVEGRILQAGTGSARCAGA
ncbi:MAG TPA: EAL domain-containing protein [Noviherbaspirillum sp.]|jgi:diguanylate cyclase (GGDEF)-like protein/PAS domain S-box-containing protein|uniref:sensor domain-containing protein n=1 Tax=Noviherbaspirillum sp. TaxID=1926288 RepID=UPI002F9529A8